MNAGCYYDSGMLVTNPYGGYVEPRTFKDYYDAILKSAGLPHFTLSYMPSMKLRNTHIFILS